MGGRSCKRFSDAAAKGVVGERHFLSVGTNDAGEHAVALPIITPARAEGAESDAKLGFEPLLINRGDDAAAQRRLSLTIIENELYTPLRIVLLSYPNSYHLLHTLSP